MVGNQLERGRVSEGDGSVVAGFDDHLQRRLHNVEDRLRHTEIQQWIQQRQCLGGNQVEGRRPR